MSNDGAKRPFFCYDKKCEILYSTFDEGNYEKGFSMFCFGKLNKSHKFVEKKAEHINTLCHCYYTPLKGAIRFLINEGDLWGEVNAKLFVLNKILPLGNCSICNDKLIRQIKSCIVISNKEKVCYRCR